LISLTAKSNSYVYAVDCIQVETDSSKHINNVGFYFNDVMIVFFFFLEILKGPLSMPAAQFVQHNIHSSVQWKQTRKQADKAFCST